jgi:hypothetical protein
MPAKFHPQVMATEDVHSVPKMVRNAAVGPDLPKLCRQMESQVKMVQFDGSKLAHAWIPGSGRGISQHWSFGTT